MSDDVIANPSEAPATATESLDTSQPINEATPAEATSPAESEPDPDSGFTAEDFKHPQYGAKAKNLYRGWQKRVTDAKSWEKKYREIEAVAKYDPEVNKALKNWWARQSGKPLATTETETPASAPKADNLDSKLAFNNVYAHLGGGDPLKGKEVFWKDYADDVEKISSVFTGNSPEEALKLSMELINLRKKVSQPVVQARPSTVATSERGRGASEAQSTKPKTAYEYAEEAAKAQGFGSLAEMAASMD